MESNLLVEHCNALAFLPEFHGNGELLLAAVLSVRGAAVSLGRWHCAKFAITMEAGIRVAAYCHPIGQANVTN